MKATAQRTYQSRKEESYDELAGAPTLTQTWVRNRFEGDIEGESWEEYLVMYRTDNSYAFVLLERVIGKLGNRSGSFVVQGRGTSENGTVRAELTILPGSGTGDLAGLRGHGYLITPSGQSSTVTFDYDLDSPAAKQQVR
ncbi:DUF3224 domain-containing protein [Spirosoma oryzicola]|uniref:DUF3224 domain-containing protein n=1 Tax=Spirosoma oryzicola TaxID=2898794 RepID=UPI001E29C239|nr:DUF3224 domain-containing protein [Spirosoma oryzicola]UHG89381.1 DUF3224 domain-containing protein [Spirosoma oryzicola]